MNIQDYQHEMAEGAHRLAVRMVMQALVEQASSSDRELRTRIRDAIERYMSDLQPQSDRERSFEELARGFAETFIQQPELRSRRVSR